jgi:cobalt-zinc-cadmium efflux system outer membrane protein
MIRFPNTYGAGLRARLGIAACAAMLLWAPPLLAAEPFPSEAAKPEAFTLTVDEAMALFLSQNLDLLMAQYGVDSAKGLEVTSKLFPNPTLSADMTGSTTKSFHDVGSLGMRLDQLFELAGKRGYRQESARFAVLSAEAAFADAVRTLGFAVKDTFYHVLQAKQKLDLARQNSANFADVVKINDIRFKKGVIAEVDLIKLRVQLVDFQNQAITANQDFLIAQNTLKGLLRVRPMAELVLKGELDYTAASLDLEGLRAAALAARPDVLAKTRNVSQKDANLKLARAFRVPDVTLGGDYGIQGPQGPNTPNQYGFGLSVPLPLFNRNQGGILQAEADLRTAQTDLEKTRLQVEIDVENAYRDFTQAQMLVTAYRGGVVNDAKEAKDIATKAYQRGGTSILDLLDAFRTFNTTMQGYIDALYAYQRSLLEIDAAVGREVTK